MLRSRDVFGARNEKESVSTSLSMKSLRGESRLRAFLSSLPVRDEAAGTTVWRASGDVVGSLLLVESGKVELRSGQFKQTLRADDWLAVGPFLHGAPADADYVTAQPTRFRELTSEQYVAMSRSHKRLRLINYLMDSLSSHVRRYNGHVNGMLAARVRNRVTPNMPLSMATGESARLLLREALAQRRPVDLGDQPYAVESSSSSSSLHSWDMRLVIDETPLSARFALSPHGVSVAVLLFEFPCLFRYDWSELKSLARLQTGSSSVIELRARIERKLRDAKTAATDRVGSSTDSSRYRVCSMCLWPDSPSVAAAVWEHVLAAVGASNAPHTITALGSNGTQSVLFQSLSPAKLPAAAAVTPTTATTAASMSELFPSWLVWSLLLKKARTRCYAAGQPLVSTELQLFSSLIYLINGTVAIESIPSTHSPGVALAFVNSPGVVGEMSFGSSSKPNAVVKAHTEIDCLVVDAQDVFRCLNKRPYLKPYIKHLLLLLRVRRSPPSLVSRQLELLGVADPPDGEERNLRSISDDVSAVWRRNSPALLDSSPPSSSSITSAALDSSQVAQESSSLSSSPASEKKDSKRLSTHWSARTMLASIRSTASPSATTTAITTLTLSGSGNDSVGYGAAASASSDEPSTVRRKGSMRMRSSTSSSAIEAPSAGAAAVQASQPLFRYAILHKLLDSKLLQNPRLWSDVEAIFFTHRYVFHQDVNERTSSDQLLLDFLVESYNNSVKASRQELPLIIEAMTRWLRLGIEHANRPTADQAAALHRQFEQFVEQVERQRSELNVDAALSGLKEALADSCRRLEQLYEQQSAAPASPTAHRLLWQSQSQSQSSPSQSQLLAVPSVDVDDFEPGELAALLTSIEWELLRALPVGELLSMRFAKPETSLKLRELVGHFNRVTNIVTTSILLRPTTLQRAQLIGAWIAVAEEAFRSYCNYSLVFQTLSALSGTSISRLRQAWAGVSKPALRTFQELQRIVNPLDNYADYRRLLADQSKPMLPVLPVFQKDLTFLEEAIAEQFRTNCGARPSLIDESALVPWSQIRQVGAIAKCVYDCQQSWGYPPPKHQAVFAQLYAGYPSLSEEQCYAVSTAVEPLRAATLAAVNLSLTADIDADKLLPELPRVVSCRVHVPREHSAAAKRLGLRGPVLAKTLMIAPNEPIKDVRPRLVDKLFWRCSGADEVAPLRQDMTTAWGLFTGETLLPDEGPWPQNAQFCDVVFKPLTGGKSKGAKGDGASTAVQQIAQLFAQVDDLRSSFQREMTTIHGEIEQMKKTIEALAALLQDRIQGEAEMSSFDNEWSD